MERCVHSGFSGQGLGLTGYLAILGYILLNRPNTGWMGWEFDAIQQTLK